MSKTEDPGRPWFPIIGDLPMERARKHHCGMCGAPAVQRWVSPGAQGARPITVVMCATCDWEDLDKNGKKVQR